MSTKKTLELEYKIALLENHIDSLQRRFDSLEQTMYALHNSRATLDKPFLKKRGASIKHVIEDGSDDEENEEFSDEEREARDGNVDNNDLVELNQPISNITKKEGDNAKTFVRSIS